MALQRVSRPLLLVSCLWLFATSGLAVTLRHESTMLPSSDVAGLGVMEEMVEGLTAQGDAQNAKDHGEVRATHKLETETETETETEEVRKDNRKLPLTASSKTPPPPPPEQRESIAAAMSEAAGSQSSKATQAVDLAQAPAIRTGFVEGTIPPVPDKQAISPAGGIQASQGPKAYESAMDHAVEVAASSSPPSVKHDPKATENVKKKGLRDLGSTAESKVPGVAELRKLVGAHIQRDPIIHQFKDVPELTALAEWVDQWYSKFHDTSKDFDVEPYNPVNPGAVGASSVSTIDGTSSANDTSGTTADGTTSGSSVSALKREVASVSSDDSTIVPIVAELNDPLADPSEGDFGGRADHPQVEKMKLGEQALKQGKPLPPSDGEINPHKVGLFAPGREATLQKVREAIAATNDFWSPPSPEMMWSTCANIIYSWERNRTNIVEEVCNVFEGHAAAGFSSNQGSSDNDFWSCHRIARIMSDVQACDEDLMRRGCSKEGGIWPDVDSYVSTICPDILYCQKRFNPETFLSLRTDAESCLTPMTEPIICVEVMQEVGRGRDTKNLCQFYRKYFGATNADKCEGIRKTIEISSDPISGFGGEEYIRFLIANIPDYQSICEDVLHVGIEWRNLKCPTWKTKAVCSVQRECLWDDVKQSCISEHQTEA